MDLPSGNANDPADAGMCHWKSSLFFLTPALALELVYPERGPYARQSSPLYGLSVAHMTVSENAGEHTMISRQAVPITASGLQGEQPLVDRRM